jgi:magnesium transporter
MVDPTNEVAREANGSALDADAPTLDETYALNPDFVTSVCEALDAGDRPRVEELFIKLHAADQADLLGLVRPSERRRLVELMGDRIDADALSDLEEDIRDEVLEVMEPQHVAAAVTELETDDMVHLIEDLDHKIREDVLEHVSEGDRVAVESALQYGDETAGRMMQREVVSAPEYWSVGQALEYIRVSKDLPKRFFEVFVVDASFHPVGTVIMSRLMREDPATLLRDVMQIEQTLIPVDMDDEEVAYLFDQYHLISAAVVDESGRIVGMITVDDVVGVVRQAASEDMLALAGVKDQEGLSDSVMETTRSRFSWLFINLLTAISASIVIAFFESTIDQIVSLAILMPIVASMGGNAGTQTLTVAVRALATKDLTATNAIRIVIREVLVGGVNGLLFAIFMGIIGGLWFGQWEIGLVLGLAMVVNMILAGLAGITIPLLLDRAGIDPAVSSTVFVTTVTDIVGFFVFLGLATMVLIG